jgi:hypothetical protein
MPFTTAIKKIYFGGSRSRSTEQQQDLQVTLRHNEARAPAKRAAATTTIAPLVAAMIFDTSSESHISLLVTHFFFKETLL